MPIAARSAAAHTLCSVGGPGVPRLQKKGPSGAPTLGPFFASTHQRPSPHGLPLFPAAQPGGGLSAKVTATVPSLPTVSARFPP